MISRASPIIPIVCDLDETLLCGDSFRSALHHLAIGNPLALARCLPALTFGWPAFKAAVADRVSMEAVRPRFNPRVVEFLKIESASGRQVVLCTATPQAWADQVAATLPGLFAHVIGSTPDLNLKGKQKAHRLVELYGERGFDYIGDSLPDLAVWQAANRAIFAGHREFVRRRLRAIKPDFIDLAALMTPGKADS